MRRHAALAIAGAVLAGCGGSPLDTATEDWRQEDSAHPAADGRPSLRQREVACLFERRLLVGLDRAQVEKRLGRPAARMPFDEARSGS